MGMGWYFIFYGCMDLACRVCQVHSSQIPFSFSTLNHLQCKCRILSGNNWTRSGNANPSWGSSSWDKSGWNADGRSNQKEWGTPYPMDSYSSKKTIWDASDFWHSDDSELATDHRRNLRASSSPAFVTNSMTFVCVNFEECNLYTNYNL